MHVDNVSGQFWVLSSIVARPYHSCSCDCEKEVSLDWLWSKAMSYIQLVRPLSVSSLSNTSGYLLKDWHAQTFIDKVRAFCWTIMKLRKICIPLVRTNLLLKYSLLGRNEEKRFHFNSPLTPMARTVLFWEFKSQAPSYSRWEAASGLEYSSNEKQVFKNQYKEPDKCR